MFLELIDKLKNGLMGQNKSEFEDVDEEDDFEFEYDDDFEDWSALYQLDLLYLWVMSMMDVLL